MWRTSLRNLAAHKIRLLATGLAVMLGVAFMAGTLVLSDTLQKTFDDLFADVFAGTDAVVRAEAAFDDPSGMGEARGEVDASLVEVVAAVDGAAAAEGQVEGYAQIVDKDGDPVGNPEMGAPTIGGNWSEVDELNPFTLVDGSAPRGDDEVVIDKKSADSAGFSVGDTATVLVKGGPREVRVAGIVRFGSADSPGGASFALFSPDAAQELVGQPGRFDSISVVASPGVTEEELVARIGAVLPDGVEAVTGEAVTAEGQDAVREGMSFFDRFMMTFAVVALLVGGFMIFNTFFITVAQRSRENALLRAIGASRRQILWSILLEAAGVGIVASLIGLAAGIGVAAALKALLAGFGLDLPAGGVVFTPRTAIVAFTAGMVVTLVAALSPARKAGKVPPVAAMRDVATASGGYGSRQRVLVGVGILGVGVAALLFGLFGGSGSALALVALGMLAVFFGVSVLGRTVALPLSRLIGAPLPRLRGITGQLARENAMRNPKRTATTASALMIGVGLVAFITVLAASTRASIDDTMDKAFTGDLAITGSGAYGMGGIDPTLTARLAELPEVSAATGLRVGAARIDGDVTQFVAVDPDSAFELFDVEPLEGGPADLGPDTIAVFADEAEDRGLAVGDRVPVVFKDTGPTELTVALVYGENQPAGNWFMGQETFEAHVADQYDFQVFLKKADGVGIDEARAAVEEVAVGYPGTKVLDQDGYAAEQSRFVDQMLGLVYALLALAIVIALLGIGNTLALSILERTRELGVMRAVGMTRAQLRASIRWESVIIALQGAVLGLVVGVFLGWALVRALADEGITTFTVPYLNLVVVVVLAGIAGVVAAVLPARRAAKLNVLRAIVTE